MHRIRIQREIDDELNVQHIPESVAIQVSVLGLIRLHSQCGIHRQLNIDYVDPACTTTLLRALTVAFGAT